MLLKPLPRSTVCRFSRLLALCRVIASNQRRDLVSIQTQLSQKQKPRVGARPLPSSGPVLEPVLESGTEGSAEDSSPQEGHKLGAAALHTTPRAMFQHTGRLTADEKLDRHVSCFVSSSNEATALSVLSEALQQQLVHVRDQNNTGVFFSTTNKKKTTKLSARTTSTTRPSSGGGASGRKPSN